MAFGLFKKNEKKTTTTNQHYYELTIKEVISETKDSISLVFEQPASGKLNYKSGQFLTLITTLNGKEVRRSYSLCSSPFTDENLVVMVKRVENGLMSNWLPENAKPGSKIKVLEPMGNFTTEFSKDKKRHLIMFAGGSGITPMMSIIKSSIHQEPDSICSLIYCNRDEDNIIFRKELDQWQTKFEGRLHVIHVLDNAPMNWQGYSGLLNHDMLVKLFERIPNWGLEKTTYLMCGPEGMMKNVEVLLGELSIPKEKIFKESFVTGTIDKDKKEETKAATVSGNTAHEVTIRYDGQEYKFVVEPNRTILETALDQGIDLPYSCQSGLCTACRGKALSGKVKLDEEEGLSQSERAEGYVLTCVGHPMSDDVVIEIG
ncbi:MAG: Flavodoxin reductases (ferredoxin-NADPH reductases) family 1 [Cytophagales bacterium]|jgi:ring-1,2-phenylacetyl-CoA epoxidase subunit PaaE|nr:ferredoxin--NADP reductase [Bacteroidota bacterium]MBS1982066.1 ferredoxin--NADP reductase [Bacteroidota bacterium]WHZ06463.1 MAG: Flavodoxin reductases (ferredoxin-NADPH reductases) family 1 [Cytophagales bacterium]